MAGVGDEPALRVLDAVLLGHVGEQQHGAVDVAGRRRAAACSAGSTVNWPSATVSVALSPAEPLAHDLEHVRLDGEIASTGMPDAARAVERPAGASPRG